MPRLKKKSSDQAIKQRRQKGKQEQKQNSREEQLDNANERNEQNPDSISKSGISSNEFDQDFRCVKSSTSQEENLSDQAIKQGRQKGKEERKQNNRKERLDNGNERNEQNSVSISKGGISSNEFGQDFGCVKPSTSREENRSEQAIKQGRQKGKQEQQKQNNREERLDNGNERTEKNSDSISKSGISSNEFGQDFGCVKSSTSREENCTSLKRNSIHNVESEDKPSQTMNLHPVFDIYAFIAKEEALHRKPTKFYSAVNSTAGEMTKKKEKNRKQLPAYRHSMLDWKKDQQQEKHKKWKTKHKSSQTAQEKQQEQFKAKMRQRKYRASLTAQEKHREQVKDKMRKKDYRTSMTSLEKHQEQIKDKTRMRGYRESLTTQEKQVEQAKAKTRMKKCRDSHTSQEKHQEQIKDKTRKRGYRESLTTQEKQVEQAKVKTRMKKCRYSHTSQEKHQEQIKDKTRKRGYRESLTTQEKQVEQAKAKTRMQKCRDSHTSQEKHQEQIKDKTRKRGYRESLTTQEKQVEQAKAKTRMQKCRDSHTSQEKHQEQVKDKTRKREYRTSMTSQEKHQEQIKDKRRKIEYRESLTTQDKHRQKETDKMRKKSSKDKRLKEIESAIKTFSELVKAGPTFICCCCHRMLYQEQVTGFDKHKYKDCDEALIDTCFTDKESNDGKQYVCNTCHWNVIRNRLPPQAVANNLQLPQIPQELEDLSNLEVTLISKRIPFMKILGLPRGKQKAIHGCVVNVPVNPDETCGMLPRLPSSSAAITVKLKRKLQYRGHVVTQKIRPWKILSALHHLKYVQKNPHYTNIDINDNWEADSRTENEELWTHLTNNDGSVIEPDRNSSAVSIVEDNDQSSKSNGAESDTDSSGDEELQDVRTNLGSIPYDSCIQPKDMSSDPEYILNMAPGEGKRPLSIHTDQHNEEMAFPNLFPHGKFGYDCRREQKLTLKQYFNARILNCDNRFASNIEYLFYAQYRCEAKEVSDCLSIALRKCKGQVQQDHITAGQIKDPNRIRELIRNDLNYHFLQKIRGSPAYFNRMMYDLLGMIRQLGTCTWFLTLSAADLKWTDTIQVIAAQHGQSFTEEEVNNMTWEQKSMWLRTNPVTSANHFNHRLQLFMRTLVLGKSNPIGHVQDYRSRIEFQQRGSPHSHMVIWVENAPILTNETVSEVEAYVQRYITCKLPPEESSLQTLVKTVQKHNHSVACKKPGKFCRFSFPRPPLHQTKIFMPSTDEVSTNRKKFFEDILAKVQSVLKTIQTDSEISLDTILEDINVSVSDYEEALHWIKTQKGQPAILLQREPNECCINNYNSHLLEAWGANLDIQYVTNVYACIMYVASYMSKPEKTLGDMLKSVSKTCEMQGPKAKMQTVAKKFLSHREVSAQEAVYRLLSIPLSKGSRQVIFVPTDLPENRTRLFKPLKVIQQLDDDDVDLFQVGIVDKYQARPTILESMCLADFSSNYTYFRKKKDSEPESDILSDTEIVQEDNTRKLCESQWPKVISLRNNKGKLSLKTKPAILRSHQFSKLKQEEQFYHSKLMLYLPWRNELEDLQAANGKYKTKFDECVDIIRDKMCEYEPNADEFQEATTLFQENGPPEDAWASLAAQTEQQQCDDTREGITVDKDHLNVAPPTDINPSDLGILHYQFELDTSSVSRSEWLNMTVSLNEEQKKVHQFIVQWCVEMSMMYKTAQRPKPFHIFLTGGAGVGKSHVIKTIVQTATQLLNIGQTEKETTVMVCAYTGAAAFNISGHTLHSAFHLPVNLSYKNRDYIPLANEQLAAMKSKLGALCILIIDEVSMISPEMLYTIHNRLCDIKTSAEPFGGVSVLAVGDLFQLPPVAQKPIFSPLHTQNLAQLYGSLWTKHFHLVELTSIMRQKDDTRFACTLNRIRLNEQTSQDVDLLQTRQTDPSSESYPPNALHIFAKNVDVDNHNKNTLEQLGNPVVTLLASDTKQDKETGKIQLQELAEKAGGLIKKLDISIGARVMLTSNIDVPDGLVNSAMGTVTGFHPPTTSYESYTPKYVFVQFDESKVGEIARKKFYNILPDRTSTPVQLHEVQVRYGSVTAKRKQFPLTLAWGITIHKAQGKTLDELVVSSAGHSNYGQMYTALSRVKSLEGLHIIGSLSSNHIKCDKRALQEMNRLRQERQFILQPPDTVLASPDHFFKISLLNVSSLPAHFQCLTVDPWIKTSHIVCLTETWLKDSHSSEDFDLSSEYCIYRQDHTAHARSNQILHGGVAVEVQKTFHVVARFQVPVKDLEYIALLVEYRPDPSIRLLIVTLYNTPNTNIKGFLSSLDCLLCRLPVDAVPTILTGDFNIHANKKDSRLKSLYQLTAYHGFQQYLQEPTHRAGATIDHIYINRTITSSIISTTPVHFTDHFHIQFAIHFSLLLH